MKLAPKVVLHKLIVLLILARLASDRLAPKHAPRVFAVDSCPIALCMRPSNSCGCRVLVRAALNALRPNACDLSGRFLDLPLLVTDEGVVAEDKRVAHDDVAGECV